MAETFSRHVLQPKPTDVFIGTPPLAFTFGLGAGVVFPASVGAATAICAKPGFDVLADTIAQHKATTLFTSPTGYRALMKQDTDASSPRCTPASPPASTCRAPPVDQWFERTGIRIIDGIGSTEMIHIFVSARGDDIRPGATGKAVPGYEATLLDENDRTVRRRRRRPPRHQGPDRLPLSRRRAPEELRRQRLERHRRHLSPRCRRLFLVRLARRRHDHLVRLQYRRAGSGERAAHARRRRRSAVIGVPDEERGQIVKAFVVLKPDASVTRARAAGSRESRRSRPTNIRAPSSSSPNCPRPHTGKLQRFKLRETP